MAILKDDSGLKVEIKFDAYSYECVQYKFFFALGNTPAFNPAFAPDGFFFSSEISNDSLIPAFEKALEVNRFILWSPDDEPRISIEIEPSLKGYEIYKQQGLLANTSLEYQETLKELDRKRALNKGKLPEDAFGMTFIVDATYLEGALRPAGGGLAFRIDANRKELDAFVGELKEEYEKFKEVNKIK